MMFRAYATFDKRSGLFFSRNRSSDSYIGSSSGRPGAQGPNPALSQGPNRDLLISNYIAVGGPNPANRQYVNFHSISLSRRLTLGNDINNFFFSMEVETCAPNDNEKMFFCLFFNCPVYLNVA